MRLALALSLAVATTPLAGQASPYIPLDHPLLPLAEHLIARGELADPSPMIRPFRRADLRAALARARLDSASASGRVAATLAAAFADRDDDAWFRVAARAGAELYSEARRDLLHPAGGDGITFLGDAVLEGRFGSLVMVSRPMAENRLKSDPDWSGGGIQRRKRQAYRFAEGYLALQSRHLRLHFGQIDRNWGPAGALGLGLASYGYPRTDLGLDVVFDRLRIGIVGTQLADMTSVDGTTHHRYFVAHRLLVRATARLDLAIWETAIASGEDRAFEPGFLNPLLIYSFPLQLGIEDDRNTIIGGDLVWRAPFGVRLEAQGMIDDRPRFSDDPGGTGEPAHPGRWAATLVASGRLGGSAGWRARLAAVNSLAYRTSDSAQSFLDRGVGIGPHFTDNVAVTVAVAVPVAARWLLMPEAGILAQGEGRIDGPFPAGPALSDTPELFIGRAATTGHAGLGISGGAGRLQLSATGGYYHTANADHVPGRRRGRFLGRLRATVGFATHGAIR